MLLDVWRTFNASGGLVGMILVGGWLMSEWDHIKPEMRLALMSLFMFFFVMLYGSLEAAFWPQFYFRIPLASLSLTWGIASAALAYLRSRDDRVG